jgi:amidophosphoribosyltransferase
LSTTWRDDDKFHDECGLFGIWNHPEAANVTYLGLYALQHRGQESAGIAATDGDNFHIEKAMGWVADVFSRERLRRLPGQRAIGHVRYSTAGSSNLRNAQPITAKTARGPIAIAHNGNLTNADELRRAMEQDGAIFQSNSDTEVILHLLARAPAAPLEEQIPHALSQVKGAYSLLIMTRDAIYAIRDPHGFRPLSLGRLDDAWVVASETCALDLMEAKLERDVEPGEIVVISDAGLRSRRFALPTEKLHCVFEYVYFARPDSTLWGRNVHTVRKAFGPRVPGGRRHRHPGPRLRDERRPRLLGGVRHPVRDGVDPQSLRGADLHRAAAGHSPLRREGEAEPDAGDDRRPARGRRRRFDRAGHHEPEDRPHDPRRRRA